ncbi:hypothetical protein RJ640_026741 [Escallonia rubra]|uniref:GAG-pre-integrase domain-containing protein n=1 Tax=Escallonia rubra TaxID=112253 RepID=A0AA88UPB8_9ASTE|nr:hypothetical protein RJ640_026741 [Escallonia rubra]
MDNPTYAQVVDGAQCLELIYEEQKRIWEDKKKKRNRDEFNSGNERTPLDAKRRSTANQDVKCLSAIRETSWLWHRRLGHVHIEHLKDISSKELVRGLPNIKFEKDKVCDAC